MAKLKQILNLDSDTGANIIGNEATPVLSISNDSTGPGLELDNLVVTSTATIATADIAAGTLDATTLTGTTVTLEDLAVSSTATINANATLEPAVHFQNTMVQGATQETMVLAVSSCASAPAIRLAGTAFVSCTSIQWTGAALAGVGAIRVAYTDTDTLGWIPILPNAMVDTVKFE